MADEKYARSQDFQVAGNMASGEKIDYSDGKHLEFWEVEEKVKQAEAAGDLDEAIRIRNEYWEHNRESAPAYWESREKS